mmetsp:Transcript_193/g.559  ORF Transcript_193/g.559 Transcript_193/m.559 type:complete len:327 (+) Transcript_193:1348-2328(+)
MAPTKLAFAPAVSETLRKTMVKDVMSGKRFVVDEKMSVVQASALLARNGISSAPIQTKTGFVGMVDYADLLTLVISGLRAQRAIDFSVGFEEQLTTLTDAALGPSSSVKLACDMSKTNPMTVIEQNETLERAALVLLENDVHRLCVVDSCDTFAGVVSLSDVLYYLKDHLDAFPEKSVEELGLLQKKVVTIPGDRPVLEALEMMVDLKISSVGVVDDDGDLVTVISLSDCKKIIKEGHTLPLLKVDCREFAAKVRSDAALEKHKGSDTFPYFAVHRDTPLKVAVSKLCAVRAHRLFVIEGGPHFSTTPIGVLSISDILKALLLRSS